MIYVRKSPYSKEELDNIGKMLREWERIEQRHPIKMTELEEYFAFLRLKLKLELEETEEMSHFPIH